MCKCVDFIKKHKVGFIVGIIAGIASLLTINAIRVTKDQKQVEDTDDGVDEFEDPDISAEE